MESSEVKKFFIENKEIDINVIQSKIDITSKKFLKTFLGFINETNEIAIHKHKKIIDVMKDKLVSLCLSYEEVIVEYVVANVVSYQRMKNETLIKEQFDNFVKFLYFISSLTSKLKLTNQIMSNVVSVINRLLDYMITKSIDELIVNFSYLIQNEIDIIKGINSFNPRIMIYIDRLIAYISKYDEKTKIKDIEKYFNTTNNINNVNEIFTSIISSLSS